MPPRAAPRAATRAARGDATGVATGRASPGGLSRSPLWNPDLAPTPPERRTWSTYNIAALWIGMSVVITTYTLASGLMSQGMNWWQAMVTILLGNTIVLIPMVLNAHAGTSTACRSRCCAGRLRGARRQPAGCAPRHRRLRLVRDPDLDRRGWRSALWWDGLVRLGGAGPHRHRVPGFWLIQVAVILKGTEGIKLLESWSAPLLLAGGLLLLAQIIWGSAGSWRSG